MKFAISLFAAAAALSFPAGAATIVQNGGFEEAPGTTGYFGATYGNMPTTGRNWDVWQQLPGWSTASGRGIEVQTKPTLGQIDPHGGNYYVELDSDPSGGSNSSMQQSVALKAGKYLLSFWYSPREQNDATNGIDYSVGNESVGALVTGDVFGPTGSGFLQVGKWTEILREFTVRKTDVYALTFSADGTEDKLGGLIDDVRIDMIAPVPVPAAGLLLLGGLGGLAALKRRRRA